MFIYGVLRKEVMQLDLATAMAVAYCLLKHLRGKRKCLLPETQNGNFIL
jgi:hypothetical protein